MRDGAVDNVNAKREIHIDEQKENENNIFVKEELMESDLVSDIIIQLYQLYYMILYH